MIYLIKPGIGYNFNIKSRVSTYCIFLVSIFALFLCQQGLGLCQGWSDLTIRLLSDSSFAVVEVEKGKKIRHCSHHDLNGKIDEEQLIYVLGTLEGETWLYPENKEIAKKHLESHYDKVIAKIMKEGLHDSVNVNKAKLAELVALPQIGPVMAVKIIKYKETYGLFEKIEDIRKVQGIGQGKFNAIKHYISVN